MPGSAVKTGLRPSWITGRGGGLPLCLHNNPLQLTAALPRTGAFSFLAPWKK